MGGGVASRPPTIRPSSKDGRPDLVRARCKTPSEDSSNKLQKVKSSRKTGQPVLSVGSNLLRSGKLASDKTSRDEVLDDGQSRSRATSTSREHEGSWDEDSSLSQSIQPSRTVEVVGQVGLIPSVVRKPMVSNRLMQFVGQWMDLPVPQLEDPFVFRAISTTGHIPVPHDMGNMMRRVLSCKKMQFHRDVVHWQTAIGKSQYAISQKDCILAASLAQIVNELRTKSLVLPEVSYADVQLNAQTREWMDGWSSYESEVH